MGKLVSLGVGLILLLASSLSTCNGQEYFLLDQQDLWDDDEGAIQEYSDDVLRALCENYEFIMNNDWIDCSDVQFQTKQDPWNENDDLHVISKREADDQQLTEGSGNGEIEKSVKEGSLLATDEEQVVDKEKSAAQNETALPSLRAANAENPESADKIDEEPSEPEAAIDADVPVEKPVDNDQPSAPEEELTGNGEQEDTQPKESVQKEPSDVAVNAEVPLEKQDPQPETEDNEQKEDSQTKEEQPSEPAVVGNVAQESPADNEQQSVVELVKPQTPGTLEQESSQKTQEFAVTKANQDKIELPPLIHSVPVSEGTTSAPKEVSNHSAEPEPIDGQQSGSAVLFKEPHQDHGPVEGAETEKQLAKMSTNAKKAAGNEEPNTAESSENVKRAGKDATILVVLFVIVIVIGAAAFTHHIVKKRKQKNEEKKSTNGQSPNNGDIEQGTEMKPLMLKSENPVIIKEYSDEKKQEVPA
ncbi:hypothetical protein ABEB36_010008 [Hypothenemus hampei]|uniref:Uncharacterized protein n=1 Tax=Hypothenemus hampei TaxID=57062 RepID=A0ABD1EI80_HYPHA